MSSDVPTAWQSMKSSSKPDRAKAYLKLYNGLQMIGWISACIITLVAIWTGQSIWDLAGFTVQVCQAAAFLEVIHAATGIVRGSPATAFLQWFGRSNVLFGILLYTPEVQQDLGVTLIFVAWSLAEAVRYPWYLSMLLGTPSEWLTWLRYSCFIPLYPLGITGEALVTVKALPHIQRRSVHSTHLPNRANFAFDYYWFCLIGVSTIMPAAFVTLYLYMLRQRRKRLHPRPEAKRD
ncbi:hypothetical protein WJX73_006389 [Symbiochloris irregularis]|uniref:Very-long-chain (3R)-3-hydroxyacyl-CoA dehydratase n=1 Tax=Symbiochloris irregularis TaxID=706552 RepID=A0AAW1NRR7_9CHLO